MNSSYQPLPDTIADIKPEEKQNFDEKKISLQSALNMLKHPDYLYLDLKVFATGILSGFGAVGSMICWPLYGYNTKKLQSSWAQVVAHCGLTGSPFEICHSYKAFLHPDPNLDSCKELADACLDEVNKNFDFGAGIAFSAIMLGSGLYSLIRACSPQRHDLMESRFNRDNLIFLAQFGIRSNMTIAQAIQIIEHSLQNVMECAPLMPQVMWGLVENYLAPLFIKPTDSREIEQEAKKSLSDIQKSSSVEIVKQIRADESKMDAILLKETDWDRRQKDTQTLDILYAKSGIYLKTAKTKIFYANLSLRDKENEHENKRTPESAAHYQNALSELTQAETLKKEADRFSYELSLFRTQMSSETKKINTEINTEREVEKNTNALIFVRACLKPSR